MLQTLTRTLTLGHKPLIWTPIYRTHIHLCLPHPHNTSLLYYFLPTLQTQTLYHISFFVHSLLHMSSSYVKWLVHYNGQIIKTDKGDTFQSSHPLFFQTKQGLLFEALKRKIHKRLCLQPLDQVCDISFWYPQVVGRIMLKFTVVQLVDDKNVKGMFFVIRQSEILQCFELYENIERNTLSTLNPEPIPHQSQYYPQSHYSHTSDATQDTFALIQPQ